ncbi:SDR family oxidoreductase [Anaeromyxobacter oryzae]|uniref:Short-chain dehydrogenase n=1 Tax=Anaeromyxobacter oryzae TaxID=2918170 RepID=A0ABN6MQI6_9BACT|nr:SDR family oxidoreductase [Anaeromyxobacter oryzae]BDG03200.1 short-chain dehydrogenase [Anaeromyxobacter oryzae]
MRGKLAGKVAVVTGASSGIGRATALRLAREGASVALAARGKDALREVEEAIARSGGRAIVVECDVADEDAVDHLAAEAQAQLGPLDLWVNDAAVLAMGRFEDTPPEVFRKLVETNLIGTVNGARAALRRFRTRGRGVLVNVASIDGRVAAPYASAYVASKHAVVGFSASLRQELRLTGLRHVHVCTVLPATIDTPLFQHAANFTGVQVKALPPVYAPERVARVIARLATHPRREVLVGTSAHLLSALWSFAPAAAERVLARMIDRQHLAHERPVLDSAGNAFGPTRPEAEHGGWRRAGGRWRKAVAFGLPAALAATALFARREE